MNTTPWVNHKVYLEMQFNVVANDPVFWGTYGLMGYHTSYSDEETLRWICGLFRHYGIDGNTASATDDSCRWPHLGNGDVDNGTVGRQLASAEADSIRTDRRPELVSMQS